MAGATVDVQIDDRQVRSAFAQLLRIMEDTTPVMAAIGTAVVAGTHRRFVSQTSPEGAKWSPLNPDYKRLKRNRRILTESGRLRDSINSRPGRDEVRVGTNVVYGAIHQFGGVIKPKGSHLVFRLASGLVMAKSVTIPARPYLGISAEDEVEIAEVVYGFLDRAAR